MLAKILDGRKISAQIREELRERARRLQRSRVSPGLAGILVGEDSSSQTYIRLKEKGCAEIGIQSLVVRLARDVAETELLNEIHKLNLDSKIHGIFIQLPLPQHLDEDKILSAISPDKDVDGFHPINVGRAWAGQPLFLPATPIAIYEILVRSGCDVIGKHVVIVGGDNLVGKPLASILLQEKNEANVTLCHPSTPDLASYTQRADILVVSVNKPRFITVDMVKRGAVVIDFGYNWVETEGEKKLVGDVDFDAVRQKAGAITPVPGGVGPMTVTMLLANTVTAAERQAASAIE